MVDRSHVVMLDLLLNYSEIMAGQCKLSKLVAYVQCDKLLLKCLILN